MHTMSVGVMLLWQKMPTKFVIVGSGSLAEALVPIVKAQLLAFLIYTTPALLQQQLQGAGQAPKKAQEDPAQDPGSELGQKLPGPCPVLRRLISFDPCKTCTNSAHSDKLLALKPSWNDVLSIHRAQQLSIPVAK